MVWGYAYHLDMKDFGRGVWGELRVLPKQHAACGFNPHGFCPKRVLPTGHTKTVHKTYSFFHIVFHTCGKPYGNRLILILFQKFNPWKIIVSYDKLIVKFPCATFVDKLAIFPYNSGWSSLSTTDSPVEKCNFVGRLGLICWFFKFFNPKFYFPHFIRSIFTGFPMLKQKIRFKKSFCQKEKNEFPQFPQSLILRLLLNL